MERKRKDFDSEIYIIDNGEEFWWWHLMENIHNILMKLGGSLVIYYRFVCFSLMATDAPWFV
jgi:hypothetical protein